MYFCGLDHSSNTVTEQYVARQQRKSLKQNFSSYCNDSLRKTPCMKNDETHLIKKVSYSYCNLRKFS